MLVCHALSLALAVSRALSLSLSLSLVSRNLKSPPRRHLRPSSGSVPPEGRKEGRKVHYLILSSLQRICSPQFKLEEENSSYKQDPPAPTMRTIALRLAQTSRSQLSGLLYTKCMSGNGRPLSTTSNSTDEPFKVEEAETINVPPPPTAKLLVLGGNGFVGSHVCKEALDKGLSVSSMSRSGRSSILGSWADSVVWHQGNLLVPGAWKDAMDGVTAVISCVGGFGSSSHMYKINGTANINAIRVAAEKGVKRFVYVSAADFGLANYLLQGYYEGKKAAEAELLLKFPYGGVILRPSFIHGTRQVGSMKIPLSIIGSPLEMILKHAKPLSGIPLLGSILTPPVNVTSMAKVAVRAATDQVFPPGIVDVYGILRYSEQK